MLSFSILRDTIQIWWSRSSLGLALCIPLSTTTTAFMPIPSQATTQSSLNDVLPFLYTFKGLDLSPPSASDSPCLEYSLPVELWEEIFRAATFIPGKDEFSLQGETYKGLIFDSQTIPTDFTEEEYNQAIETRLSIVMVCKLWYQIGMTLLWSDLRLDFMASDNHIQLVKDKLRDSPQLASYVKRLQFTSNDLNIHEAEQIFSRLTNLKILVCPTRFGEMPEHVRPDVLILQRESLDYAYKRDVRSFWQGIRVLHIEFRGELMSSFSNDSVEFPYLEYLSVIIRRYGIAHCVSTYWRVPSLRILRISSSAKDELDWFPFLDRCSSTLEKLQINIDAPPHFMAGTPIVNLQHLRVLYVCARCIALFRIISAPQLHRCGVYGTLLWPWKTSSLIKVDEFLNLFPMAKEMALSHSPRAFEGPDLNQYIDECRQRGVHVSVHETANPHALQYAIASGSL